MSGRRADGVSRPPPLAGAAEALLLAALTWGVFAFGAVYAWARWPLAIGVLISAFAALRTPGPSSFRDIRPLAIALGAVVVAACVQLVPLPPGIMETLSPHEPALLRELEPAFAAGAVARRALSIVPAATMKGIGLGATFAVLIVASARLFSLAGARRFATGLAVIGTLVALTGIVQRPLFTGRIYGFWTPEEPGSPFGPFVNRNHFAGWMLMALPLTLGLLCGGIARDLRGVAPGWRARVVWLSSPAANRLLLLTAAAIVMALSLVLTLSRSGIVAMTAAFALTALAVVRHLANTRRRAVALGSLALVFVAAVGWAGIGGVLARFAAPDSTELGERPRAWADAMEMIADFPVAGTGLNTYGAATLFYRRHATDLHYAEAHNDYLQLAAEGGLLIAVPAAAAAVLLVVAIRRRFADDRDGSLTAYWLRAGASAGLLAVALQETLDFSLQMPGNAALFAALCGVALHDARARLPPEGGSRVLWGRSHER